MWLVMSTIHSDLVFDNGGICGGYPAPTARYFYTVKDSDVLDRGAKQLPLPHAEGDPREPDVKKLLGGDFELEKGFYHHPRKEGDVFVFFYNSSGGYGDVLERPTELIRMDLDNEVLSPEMALKAHKAVVSYDEAADAFAVDEAATDALREAERQDRLDRGVPVSQWHEEQRKRVVEKDFAPMVQQMYAGSFAMSERWSKEYIDFWKLDPEFTW
jgi:acetone carboxylase alpha subunit